MDDQNTTPSENNDSSGALPDPVTETVAVDTDEQINDVQIDDEQIEAEDADGATTPRRNRFRSPLVAGVVAGILGLGIGAGAVALIGDGAHDNHHRDGAQDIGFDRHMPGGHMDHDSDGN